MIDMVDALSITDVGNSTVEKNIADAVQHTLPDSPALPCHIKGLITPLSDEVAGVEDLSLKNIVAEDVDWVEVMGVKRRDWKLYETGYMIAENVGEAEDVSSSEAKLDKCAPKVDDHDVKLHCGSPESSHAVVKEKEDLPELSLRDTYEQVFKRPEFKSRPYQVWWKEPNTLHMEEVEFKGDAVGEDVSASRFCDASHDRKPEFRGWEDRHIPFEHEPIEVLNIHTAYRPKESPNGSADVNRILGKPLSSPSRNRRHAPIPENPQHKIFPAHHGTDSMSPHLKPDRYQWDDWYSLSCSKNYLNDGTDIAEAAEDLKTLSSFLSFHTVRTRHRHSQPLTGQLLDQWLNQSIAVTEKLISSGNKALASKASEMIGKVLTEAS